MNVFVSSMLIVSFVVLAHSAQMCAALSERVPWIEVHVLELCEPLSGQPVLAVGLASEARPAGEHLHADPFVSDCGMHEAMSVDVFCVLT
jgi:hypothetical protein